MLRKLHDAAEYPQHFFLRLQGEETYRLRIGDYRIICEVDHHERVIHIMDIGHRKNVYD